MWLPLFVALVFFILCLHNVGFSLNFRCISIEIYLESLTLLYFSLRLPTYTHSIVRLNGLHLVFVTFIECKRLSCAWFYIGTVLTANAKPQQYVDFAVCFNKHLFKRFLFLYIKQIDEKNCRCWHIFVAVVQSWLIFWKVCIWTLHGFTLWKKRIFIE